MNIINDTAGKPYLSVIDNEYTVKIQLHSYDDIGPFYLTLDKRSLAELSNILKTFSRPKYQD